MMPVIQTTRRAVDGKGATAPFVSFLAIALVLFANGSWGEEPAPVGKPAPKGPATRPASRPTRKDLKLPGLVTNFRERCVDVESAVCLREGLLELIACTKGTKEHESIVVIKARPAHIHVALLLLGARNGNPAMRKPIDKDGSRWIDVPPSGDPVDVYLVFKSKTGTVVERPISDFVTAADRDPDGKPGAAGDGAPADVQFPHTFVFAGSLLRRSGSGPRKYLSDLSGNVISVVTFGDELLCLPGIQGHDNGSLMWQVNATDLPAIGTKVTLRLRPQVRPARKGGTPPPEGGTRQTPRKQKPQ